MLPTKLCRFRKRMHFIEITLQEAINLSPHLRNQIAVYSVSELQLAWAQFCKDLIISSAYSNGISFTGKQIQRVSGVKSIRAAKTLISDATPTKTHGPTWHDPKEVINLAHRLNLDNRSTITASLGVTGLPTKELKSLRDYFMHPTKNTADIVRRYRWGTKFPLHHRYELISQPTRGGSSLIKSWMQQLSLVAELSCH